MDKLIILNKWIEVKKECVDEKKKKKKKEKRREKEGFYLSREALREETCGGG